VLVPGTVANHVLAILDRLGLRNRTQIGVWAAEHGLYRSNGDPRDDEPGERVRWLGSSIGRRPAAGGTGGEAAGAEDGA
jgi:hypothetical protein